ncbi:SDR family NAD(P)-dependent oxidoreductase [Sneathiella limimaris]|uniref:SDR family NAD(P)-dependent oxidoreductase n=1 Tax=Sneathiella limimaris TaxID=1964213 RepID=UPI00146F5F45|nr:SDR family NAD(P)-dependent oxidoreductase [Sneathiella limimaris]
MSEHYWIIGASTGIGADLALQLGAEGHTVTISARNEAKLEEVASKYPKQISCLPMDICNELSIESAFSKFEALDKLPDCVVISAGTYSPQTVSHFSLENAEKTMALNYIGTCRILERLLPIFQSRDKGHIALIASVAGYQGLPKSLAYGPTKAALINLAEGLQIELMNSNVKVQVINPGFVKTPLTAQNKFNMPFLMEPEEAARKIAQGLKKDQFEIAFPLPFVLILKTIRLLPYWLSLKLIAKLTS